MHRGDSAQVTLEHIYQLWKLRNAISGFQVLRVTYSSESLDGKLTLQKMYLSSVIIERFG